MQNHTYTRNALTVAMAEPPAEGNTQHYAIIDASSGKILETFDYTHDPAGGDEQDSAFLRTVSLVLADLARVW